MALLVLQDGHLLVSARYQDLVDPVAFFETMKPTAAGRASIKLCSQAHFYDVGNRLIKVKYVVC